MSKRGITITNYLVSADPEGISLSYVSNWTGQAIKIPRNLFSEVKEFPELKRPGIYYLIGFNDENPDEKVVYVGEANHLYDRLATHFRDEKKSFFEMIIAFSSKDDNMTVSHTKYLEAKALKESVEKPGYIISNRKDGNKISLPQMVQDEMDTYFDNMKILLPIMGLDLFKPALRNSKFKNKDDKLYLNAGDIHAISRPTANGLLVLKNSKLKANETDSLAPAYSKIRRELIEKGYVVNQNGELIFAEDYEFSSPSQAGAVILGYSVNGRIFWRDLGGKTMKEIEEDKISNTPNKV